MSEFRMPSLGADMEAGTLVEWLVKPGTPVKRGDIIAVVETQKGAIEIEVFEDGLFEKSLVDIGAKVPVGTPLALITAPGEAPAEPAPATEAAPAKEEPPAKAPAPEAPPPPPPPPPAPAPVAAAPVAAGERTRISPAARRMAEAQGIDLKKISGTGPDGAIVLADVAALIGKAGELPPAPAPARRGPAAGMRAAIAAAMAHANREIPHYYLSHTVDLTPAEDFIAGLNADREPADRMLLGALFVKAVALAARKYPEFNGHYVDDTYEASHVVHVGVAINIRGTGLVAPAIHNTDTLGLDEVMAGMRDLVARVRAGRFRSSEMSDPTITISSLGERGVESLFGVIYPPQVAIVGFGMPVTRPWIVGDAIGPRRVVSVTLSGDHRVSDGHRGALFLSAIENFLTNPEAL